MIEVTAYTDGSSSSIDRSGGWGVVLLFNGVSKELSGSATDTTNNRMELTAVLKAVEALKVRCRLLVRTDSTDVIGWLRGTYARRNEGIKQLCDSIQAAAKERGCELVLQQVEGHSGDYWNDRADLLATMARQTMLSQQKEGAYDGKLG